MGKADFFRVFVMYIWGGIYLDADVVPCVRDSLRFFTSEPGVISFPFTVGDDGQVNGCAISAPKNHKLMKMALDHFFAEGPKISILHNLLAAGPAVFADVVNNYLVEVGIIDTPLIVMGADYLRAPVVQKRGLWHYLADLRFMKQPEFEGLYHLHFMTWINRLETENTYKYKCRTNLNLIESWLETVCSGKIRNHDFGRCGEDE